MYFHFFGRMMSGRELLWILFQPCGFFQWVNPDARPLDGRNWPGLWLKFDQGGVHPLSENRFVNIAHLAKYADAFEAANHLCEVNATLSGLSLPKTQSADDERGKATHRAVMYKINPRWQVFAGEKLNFSERTATSTISGEPFECRFLQAAFRM